MIGTSTANRNNAATASRWARGDIAVMGVFALRVKCSLALIKL
jgi:hypothetical protein